MITFTSYARFVTQETGVWTTEEADVNESERSEISMMICRKKFLWEKFLIYEGKNLREGKEGQKREVARYSEGQESFELTVGRVMLVEPIRQFWTRVNEATAWA